MDGVLAHIIKSFCCVSVAALLLNNVSLVQTVASFIPKSVSPKVHTTVWENTLCMRNVHCIECLCIFCLQDHSLLSASALHLIAELIDHQCLSNINVGIH